MLVSGSLAKARSDGCQEALTLQLTRPEPAGSRYKCSASDGGETVKAMFGSQLNELVVAGKLKAGAIVTLPASSYSFTTVNDVNMLMMPELEVVQQGEDAATPPVVEEVAIKAEVDLEAPVPLDTPDAKKAKLNSGHANGAGGRALSNLSNGVTQPRAPLTPGPAPSPSEEPRAKLAPKTPGPAVPKSPPQPPSNQKTPSAASRTAFHPIAALHPYNDQWCIRAKLLRKAPIRTINSKIGESKLLSVELVDDSGVAIQGTFWRQLAETCNDTMQEGKVYVFTRFQVKPANKQYASVKNDYEITFTERSEVVEAADQDDSAMCAEIELVPIETLTKYITRKAPVDVLGVVVSLGTLGNVKRKSDNTELQRRDVTLGDKSGKTVVVTLWGDKAADPELDQANNGTTLMQISSCRVTDYNGCSVSTLQKSMVTLNPTSKAAEELRTWYNAHGATTTFAPVSSDGARQGGAAGGSRDRLDFLKDLPATASGAADAKPEYHNMFISVAQIKEEQNHSYLANPENGRKVVEQEPGKFWCEADSKYVAYPEQRYVLSFQAIDSTGIAYLNCFNKEGEMLLGMKADALAALKASGSDKFGAALKDASWREWAVTTASKGREYQGEVKVRHQLFSLRPVDFVKDGMKLVDLINRY